VRHAVIALSLIMALIMGATGCFPFWLFDDDEGDIFLPQPMPEQPEQVLDDPPTIEVSAPMWPPMSELSAIAITCRDDLGLDRLVVQFRNGLSFSLSGVRESETFIAGSQLGEGFGTLEVAAFDSTFNITHHDIQNFLVDLSPPEITLGPTVLPHGADFEIWVADAWILGGAKLTVGEIEIDHAFEAGYPTTLGTTWDMSLVKFATVDLPAGTHGALVEARDAAGHAVAEIVELTLDGDPPTVAITSPAPGAMVSGLFDVIVTSADPGGGPTWIAITLDGTPVGTAVGPSATVTLDAAELVPGPAVIEATAHDQAGHTAVFSIAIEISH
jgi:hypothetical protein